MFNPVLARELGVVASAADDWDIGSVVWTFSIAFVFLGVSTTLLGKRLEEFGPRVVGVAAACLWGGGFLVAAVGIYVHQIWIVYLGYGALGGMGLGLAYVSPVATMIRWFPDRAGMASGMAIMGFGGGAIVAVPLKEFLLRTFREAPTYLGAADSVSLITEGGRRFVQTSAGKLEAVAGADGVYAVGTGSTGAAATFFALGVIYFSVMFAASMFYRTPPDGWSPNPDEEKEAPSPAQAAPADGRRIRPVGWSPDMADARALQPPSGGGEDVHLSRAHRTPQFYLLWIILCFNVTAGIGLIGVAKTMVTDIFGATLPHIATPAFAAGYVLMISVFNLGGRFFWASLSDTRVGRRGVFYLLTGAGAALYACVPIATASVGANPSVVWLIMFCVATMIIFTMYGGGFSTMPAYVADTFGRTSLSGIYGRALTAWSVAGAIGPFALTRMRELSEQNSIAYLAARASPRAFEDKFGAPVERLSELVAAKTVTIERLMEIAPPGSVDPTPSLYNTTMLAMAALLVIGFFANAALKPVAARHRMKNTHPDDAASSPSDRDD